MTRGILIRLAFVAVFLLGFWCGLKHHDTPQHHMNELMRVGFVIVDPEGFEVQEWKE